MISWEGKWEMGRAQPSKTRMGKRAKLRVINDCFEMNIEIILCSSSVKSNSRSEIRGFPRIKYVVFPLSFVKNDFHIC